MGEEKKLPVLHFEVPCDGGFWRHAVVRLKDPVTGLYAPVWGYAARYTDSGEVAFSAKVSPWIIIN